MSDPYIFINNDIAQSYSNTGTYSNIDSFKINAKFDVNESGMVQIYKSLKVDKNLTLTGNAIFDKNLTLTGNASFGAGLRANGSFGTSGYVLKTNGTNVFWAPITTISSLNTTGNTTLGDASNDVMTVNGKANFNNAVAITGNTITNTIISSDSNLRHRFDTANKRILTNIYGFDFIDNGGVITPTNKTKYTYVHTGANQTLVVPAGINYIFVKMWGGGGGGGSYGGWRQGSLGGAGGFSHGIIAVVPGETITIRVGGKGIARPAAARAYPDGGGACTSTGSDNRYAASGGGSSSILVPSQSGEYVIVAGGGGGGGSVNSYDLNSAGAGGGLIGECGVENEINGNVNNGKGGTQVAGGAGGTGIYAAGPGGSFNGGDLQNTACYGGGGGGGFFGGGAGNYNGSNSMGGGGGGSGRIHSSVIIGATYTGQQFIPPFFNDPDLAHSSTVRYAKGGDEGGNGGHGFIVLYY
jgi:hypothetical protein